MRDDKGAVSLVENTLHETISLPTSAVHSGHAPLFSGDTSGLSLLEASRQGLDSGGFIPRCVPTLMAV